MPGLSYLNVVMPIAAAVLSVDLFLCLRSGAVPGLYAFPTYRKIDNEFAYWFFICLRAACLFGALTYLLRMLVRLLTS